MKLISYVSATLALFTLGLQTAKADLAFTEGGTSTAVGGNGLVGFNFTLNNAIDVTQLGFFGLDLGGDTPWVALYNVTTGTQLAAITTFTPTPGWQYISLGSPVTLTVGSTYQVVATAYWSPRYADTASFTYGSAINPLGSTTATGWGGWGTPVMATAGISANTDVTANFVYTLSSVPEPASYAVITGIAILGIVLARRRRG